MLCEKSYSLKFPKIHRKLPVITVSFLIKLPTSGFFLKKRDSGTGFENTFLQDTFGWLLLQINDSEAVLVAVQAFSKE